MLQNGIIKPSVSPRASLSCSALVDTVTLLREKIQRQLNLPATPLKSHYHLAGATGDALSTLRTIQVDIVWDSKI